MNPSDFYTRDSANEGKRFQLELPNGKLSEDYLVVMNQDADAIVEALAKWRALSKDNLALPEAKQLTAAQLWREQRYVVLVPAVKSWSFSIERTDANVEEFLRQCPQITAEVERLVYDRQGFFILPSAN